MSESFIMGEDDLQMSYVFVTIFIKISLRIHSVGVFQSVLKYIHPCWRDYILVSCISFSTQDPYAEYAQSISSPRWGQSMANAQ